MESLWNEPYGAYINYNTDADTLVKPRSMAMFFPLLGQLGDAEQQESILKKFYNENFKFNENEMWPVFNFLTYLSFRKAGFWQEAKELSLKSNQASNLSLYKETYLISNPLNYSNAIGSISLTSKKNSFKIALLGVTEFVERNFIPKPESLLK